jgi:L-histidine Nalpha-methyltransferase
MQIPEYYLPECESEILKEKSKRIFSRIIDRNLDIIELGAGDGTKTLTFLKEGLDQGKKIRYIPVDISDSLLEFNQKLLGSKLNTIDVTPLIGDYFSVLESIKGGANRRVFMFMGSNIGNYTFLQAVDFLTWLGSFLNEGDFLLLAFDLVKDPHIVNLAYNDPEGITGKFNLNLLERINLELDANFDLNLFTHSATYSSLTHEVLLFLISLEEQEVRINDSHFSFKKYENILTEISRKYSLEEIETIAKKIKMNLVDNYYDSRNYYCLSLLSRL